MELGDYDDFGHRKKGKGDEGGDRSCKFVIRISKEMKEKRK